MLRYDGARRPPSAASVPARDAFAAGIRAFYLHIHYDEEALVMVPGGPPGADRERVIRNPSGGVLALRLTEC
ncbi:hypothetical protein GCM10010347_12800 [Streptomyces cirratus]|uniref:Uncharacterized protein n=1 Tax=Streptomyces cirratus TaxID=68187 RepID=A0ABQ3EKV1_9ACTN|nr:hypothetical protein GCM10010347_12800 [Streptomyces cirratus]